MPLIEVFTPKGSLSEEQRKVIAEDLFAEVLAAEGAPDNEAARSISWVLIHDVETWSVGGQEVGAGEPPRFIVKVSVPKGALNDERRADMMARVNALLAKSDPDPSRFQSPLAAWVHINEVPDGNWGAAGNVVRVADVAALMGLRAPVGAAQ